MRTAAVSMPPTQPAQTAVQTAAAAPTGPPKLDRVQMSMWALLREQQGGLIGAHSLSSGGSLGASQTGARLIYNFNRQLGLALRTSADVGRRGGEVALGIRVQPVRGSASGYEATFESTSTGASASPATRARARVRRSLSRPISSAA